LRLGEIKRHPRFFHVRICKYSLLFDFDTYSRSMAAKFDESEFIDTDYESSKESLGLGNVTTTTMTSQSPAAGSRPPTREEIEAKVTDAHTRLAELKRAQEQLERERAALEETR